MNTHHSKITYDTNDQTNHHQQQQQHINDTVLSISNNEEDDGIIDEISNTSFNYKKANLQGLILKNQQLQELLQENQDSLRLLSIDNSTIYHENLKLANLLKQRNHALDHNKEEIWNLEVAKQDLSRQLRELELRLKKVLKDQSRWLQQEYHLKQELDYYKQQHTEWKESMMIAKKDKLELMILKKKLTSLQQQQQSSTSISYLDNESIITTAATTTSSSISSSSSLPSLSSIYHLPHPSYPPFFHMVMTLQTNLGNAQKMIHKLKYDLEFEKNKRLELESFWRDTQDFIENRNMMINHNNNNNNACNKTKKEISAFPSSTFSSSHEKNQSQETFLVGGNRRSFKSLGDELSMALQKQQEQEQQINSNIISNNNNNNNNDNNTPLLTSPKEKEKKNDINDINEDNNTELYQHSSQSVSISSLPPSPPVELISCQQHENTDGSDSDSDDFDHSIIIDENNKELKDEDMYGSVLTTESFIYSSQKLIHHHQHTNNNNNNKNQYHDSNQFKQKYNNNHNNNNKSITINDTPFLIPTSLSTSSYYHRRIKALSHTMIGERLWKYINNNNNNKRHERYFWLHPYSKTIYWSIEKPGMDGYQYNTKSAYISSFHIIDETGFIIELQTMNRKLYIQCPNETSYQSWYTAFHYLIGDDSFSSSLIFTSSSLIQHQNHLSKLLMHFPPLPSTLNLYKNHHHSSSSIIYENNTNNNDNTNEENENQDNGLYSNTTLSSFHHQHHHHTLNEIDQSSFKEKRKTSYLLIPSTFFTKLLHFKNKKERKKLNLNHS
ncbi:unnamed protein product [Cunninghamella blakesleeana]